MSSVVRRWFERCGDAVLFGGVLKGVVLSGGGLRGVVLLGGGLRGVVLSSARGVLKSRKVWCVPWCIEVPEGVVCPVVY